MGIWGDLFEGDAEREAAERNRAALGDYKTQGFGFLDKGFAGSSGAINNAIGAYSPLKDLAAKYGAGSSLALDAYGVNGAVGNDRARDAFRAGPGYEFARDQGLEAVNRRRAIGGGWDSGNTDIDLLKFSTGLADQEFDQWRTGLAGFTSPELAATSGAAAGTAAGYGTLADLHARDADARTNIVGSVTSGNMQANNAEAAGRSAGARNLLGAGLSLANLAAGGGFGFGGGGGSQMVNGYNVARTGGGNPFPMPI